MLQQIWDTVSYWAVVGFSAMLGAILAANVAVKLDKLRCYVWDKLHFSNGWPGA